MTNGTSITIRPRSFDGPPGYGRELTLRPETAAILTIDVQRFFVESLPFEAMQRAIEPIARLLPVAREAGMPSCTSRRSSAPMAAMRVVPGRGRAK